MTCAGCEAKVKYLLSSLDNIDSVETDRLANKVTIETATKLDVQTLQLALGGLDSKYQISFPAPITPATVAVPSDSWVKTYLPVLLIFGYLLGVTLFIQWSHGRFMLMHWMQHFMAGFFLVFSFFKLLNLRGFAESYAMYDVVAKRWHAWGYIYPFVELGLGLAILSGRYPYTINVATLVIMVVSIIGVLQSVINKKAIKCACLGTVFNLPMSTITIIEDGLMIAMSVAMLCLI